MTTNTPRPADEILTDLLLHILSAEAGMNASTVTVAEAMEEILNRAYKAGRERKERQRMRVGLPG